MNPTDPLLRARPVILDALGGICRRTLYEMIRRGDFPAPDAPAVRRGEPDRWLQSTARRGIAEFLDRSSHEKG
jgi:predicted DNA-binding transcriptional regulator AlpA